MEIGGDPQTAKEVVSSIIGDVGKAIRITVLPKVIVVTHRVPLYRTKKIPPIIVQFSFKMVRDEWIAKARERRDLTADLINLDFPKRKVFINGHLKQRCCFLAPRTDVHL